jgi:hypothetical protein
MPMALFGILVIFPALTAYLLKVSFWTGFFVFSAFFIVSIAVAFCFENKKSNKKRQLEMIDRSEEAGEIAHRWGQKTSEDDHKKSKYKQQGVEIYLFYRSKCYTNEKILNEIENIYRKAYEKAVIKAIKNITK